MKIRSAIFCALVVTAAVLPAAASIIEAHGGCARVSLSEEWLSQNPHLKRKLIMYKEPENHRVPYTMHLIINERTDQWLLIRADASMYCIIDNGDYVEELR